MSKGVLLCERWIMICSQRIVIVYRETLALVFSNPHRKHDGRVACIRAETRWLRGDGCVAPTAVECAEMCLPAATSLFGHEHAFLTRRAWGQTTVLMDSWLKHKLADNSMMFGHRVGAIPTNVIDANRRYLV